jgi:hypothetical protein
MQAASRPFGRGVERWKDQYLIKKERVDQCFRIHLPVSVTKYLVAK